MTFSLKAKIEDNTSAGITISAEGIALAIIQHSKIAPILKHAQFHPCTAVEQTAVIAELVHQHHLDKRPCNLVLAPEEYQLTQIDAPEVAKQEMASAIHWQIKDLIDFHIDDAVIDHIELPNNSGSGKQQLLIVASRQSIIQSHVDLLQAANCRLATIDIAIQASRNLVSQLPTEHHSVGLLNLWDNLAKLSVILNNDIYINRTSSIGAQSLAYVSEDDINSQSILDSLVLELQRTFDYYESHSRQAAIAQLVIINNSKTVDNIADLIQQRLGIDCHSIELKDIITVSDEIGDTIDQRCLMAIGGALRSTH